MNSQIKACQKVQTMRPNTLRAASVETDCNPPVELHVSRLQQVLADQGSFDSSRKSKAKDRIEADIRGNTNFRKGTYVIDRCIERRPGIYIEIRLNAGLLRRSRTDRVASHNGAGGIQAGHDGGKIGRRERCR